MKLVASDTIFSSVVIPKDSVTRCRPIKEEKPLGSVYSPHVKGVSEKLKNMWNRYNIRTNFKTKHTPRTQNYMGFGLFPSSGILETRKHNVSETGSVSVLR
jgi:hypothetical protein